MELLLKRREFTDNSTIGDLFINGKFECYILEDKDRGLIAGMPLDFIAKKKVYGKTAIPLGRYQIAITFSARFKKYLPLLIGVPGYDGIRMHPGNKQADTLGCLLPGESFGVDEVMNSRKAFNTLFEKMQAVEKKEKIFITIQ